MKTIKEVLDDKLKVIACNGDISIRALKQLLEEGSALGGALLYGLTCADAKRAWDSVSIDQVQDYMRDGGFTVSPESVLEYLKNDYNLIDADAEIRHALESVEK